MDFETFSSTQKKTPVVNFMGFSFALFFRNSESMIFHKILKKIFNKKENHETFLCLYVYNIGMPYTFRNTKKMCSTFFPHLS